MKDIILQKLKENISGYVSGEALSSALNVSRTAVWKYIKELKKDGYLIDSSTRKGYKLDFSPDILSAGELQFNLETSILGRKIFCFESIDSTNSYAKKIAAEGCEDGTVVIADVQTAGRGRLGRTWDSTGGKGIWMSVVLRPSGSLEDVQIITLAASVAVVNALKGAVGVEAGIKWPNDIILKGKKVCGILTEMSSEIDRINYLVIGIGVNVNHNPEDFPESLRDSATSLKSHSADGFILERSQIIKRILVELEVIYKKVLNGSIPEIVQAWKRYSVTLGREVKLKIKDCEHVGVAKDVTADGKLVVSCNDGIVREVMSGEVQVRGLLGYI